MNADSGTRASESAPRRPDIQGLRALAVLAVVAFHAGLPIPGGFVGFDVFFVISGFVITSMLQREWERTGRLRFGHFYLRRFKRLTPALALMVAVTMVGAELLLSPFGPQQTAARTAAGAMTLTANFVIAATTGGYFDAPAFTNPLLNTWSLSVEEQFYLGFPALIALGWYLARRRPALRASPVLMVGTVAVASFALAVAGSRGVAVNGSTTLLGFYSPFTRAWEFAAGALLALVIARAYTSPAAIRAGSGIVGLALVAASLWLVSAATPFPGTWTLLPVIGTLLLLFAGDNGRAPTSRWLSARPMVRIGDWSYSIYLWHWPFIVFARIIWPHRPALLLAAAGVSLVPALASYLLVENPIRNLRPLGARPTALVVAATVVPPLLLAGVVGVGATHYWQPKVQTIVAQAQLQHAGYALGCHYGPKFGSHDPVPCEWNASAKGRPVYLLGDSNAAQFVEALISSATTLRRPLIVTTSSGCPLLDLRILNPNYPGYDRACRARNIRLLAWMAEQRPGTVILAASDEYWLSPAYGIVQPDGGVVSDQATKVRLMGQALTATVERLKSAGDEVQLIQTIPHFEGSYAWDPATCDLADAIRGCLQRMPLAAALERSAAVRAMIAQVGTRTGVEVRDFASIICPDGTCVNRTASMPVYRDAMHISVAMSYALAPYFNGMLAASSAVG